MTHGSQRRTCQPGDENQDLNDPMVYTGPTATFGISSVPRSRIIDNIIPASTSSSITPHRFSLATTMTAQSPPETLNRWIVTNEEPWSTSRSTTTLLPSTLNSSFLTPRAPLSSDTESVITNTTPPTIYSFHSEDTGMSYENLNIQGPFAGMGMQDVGSSSRTCSTSQFPSSIYAGGSCHVCGYQTRTRSEFKKHHMKHEKPFRCRIYNCDKFFQGFTTSNDLDRHEWSKHQIFPKSGEVKAYRCASANCVDKPKVWYRLDNFTQHVERMHSKEDKKILFERSEFVVPRPKDQSDSQPQIIEDFSEITPTSQDPYGLAMTGQWYPSTDGNLTASEPLTGFLSQDTHKSYVEQDYLEASSDRFNAEDAFATIDSSGTMNSTFTPEDDSSQASGIASGNASFGFGISHNPAAIFSQPAELMIHPEVQAMITMAKARGCDLKALADAIYSQLGVELDSANYFPPARDDSRTVCETETSSLPSEESHPSVLTLNCHTTSKPAVQSQTARIDTQVSPRTDVTGRICGVCGKVLADPATLKKHLKRHDRRYGCTDTDCKKTFGSKDDWKRHENTQHDSWHCAVQSRSSNTNIECDTLGSSSTNSESIKPCGKHFKRKEEFIEHLKHTHNISEKSRIDSAYKNRHLGGDNQSTFWCGFCGHVQPLGDCGSKWRDVRFNHIGDHFASGRSIEGWVPEPGKTKRIDSFDDRRTMLVQGKRRAMYTSETPENLEHEEWAQIRPEASAELSTSSASAMQLDRALDSSSYIDPAILDSTSPPAGHSLSLNKRQREPEEHSAFPSTSFSRVLQHDAFGYDSSATTFNCCNCHQGPYRPGLEVMCGEFGAGCAHVFCNHCTGETNLWKRVRGSKDYATY